MAAWLGLEALSETGSVVSEASTEFPWTAMIPNDWSIDSARLLMDESDWNVGASSYRDILGKTTMTGLIAVGSYTVLILD